MNAITGVEDRTLAGVARIHWSYDKTPESGHLVFTTQPVGLEVSSWQDVTVSHSGAEISVLESLDRVQPQR